MDKHTQLICDPRQAPMQINSLQPPVYHASTIVFDNTKALFKDTGAIVMIIATARMAHRQLICWLIK